MSLIAKIYVTAIVVIGAAVTLSELTRWQSQDLFRFLCYLALATAASRLKVSLPGITGALSVLFIFILFAIVELSMPEALFIGCSAILMQCLWNYKHRPKWHQVLFNLGSIAITVVAASETGYVTSYQPVEIAAAIQAKLKPGAKVQIAVHCHQTGGGQGIDVGVIDVVEKDR